MSCCTQLIACNQFRPCSCSSTWNPSSNDTLSLTDSPRPVSLLTGGAESRCDWGVASCHPSIHHVLLFNLLLTATFSGWIALCRPTACCLIQPIDRITLYIHWLCLILCTEGPGDDSIWWLLVWVKPYALSAQHWGWALACTCLILGRRGIDSRPPSP